MYLPDELYVLAQLCCDEATFTGCTSRAVLSKSGPAPSVFLVVCLLVSLTHTGLVHRCLGTLCICASVFVWVSVCVCAPPASPQQDCQSVGDYTPTRLGFFCFLTVLPLSHSHFRPILNILIESAEYHSMQVNEDLIATFSLSLLH